MKKIILTTVFFLISFSSFAADNFRNFIVAKINNKAITNSEIVDRYRFVISVSKIKITTDLDKKMLFEQIIDKMIDEELIRQEATNLKIEASKSEIDDALEVLALRQKKNVPQLRFFFINQNLSFENYLKQIESEILWSKIISEVLKSKVKSSDVEVREFFEQHKLSSDVKKFLIAEILISPSKNAAQLANKLSEELKRGADFKNIVKQFSSSLTSESAGEIGWVFQGDIDPKIYAEISKIGKGEYSSPVQLADGFHIFKLLDAKIERNLAEQDLNAAKNAIFSHKLQSLAKGYLMDLRKKSFVEIDGAAGF